MNIFFFNDTATTEIYTLSLHDALPISPARAPPPRRRARGRPRRTSRPRGSARRAVDTRAPSDEPAHRTGSPLSQDRKSTRLNSSHANISYAVFCLKKKNPDYEECMFA